jgi:hypothetical protein
MNYLPRLTSNHDPLDLCLLRSYRFEPPALHLKGDFIPYKEATKCV